MSHTDRALAELGVSNTIYTRTAYRTAHKLTYAITYIIITVASVVLRKKRLEIANVLLVKLGKDPIKPAK